MKVIVRTETKLGSGTLTNVYAPAQGVEFTPDEYYRNALWKLYDSDLNFFGDLVEDSEIWEDDLTAYVYTSEYSIHYETTEVEMV